MFPALVYLRFMLLTLTWAAERGLSLGPLFLRYYQILFFAGFLSGFYLMRRYFKKEGVSQEILDNLLIYTVIATIIGARLGHVFFYDWAYYRQHVVEIFMPWKGGLASHGAAIVIPTVLYYFARVHLRPLGKSYLWLMDRVVITVALAGALIRVGNFTNSEIYGDPANSAVETVYLRPVLDYTEQYFSALVSDVTFVPTGNSLETDSLSLPEYELQITPADGVEIGSLQSMVEVHLIPLFNLQKKDNRHLFIPEDAYVQPMEGGKYRLLAYGIPRLPSQLFEALGYLLIFLMLFFFGERGHLRTEGRIFGLFLLLVFGFRIAIEFVKANQKTFEEGMALNMGQWLSIPLVLLGIGLILHSFRTKNS